MFRRLTIRSRTPPRRRTPAGTAAATNPAADAKAQLVKVQEPDPSPFMLAEKVLGPIVEPLTTVGIVLVVVVFLLLQREDLRNRMIRLFGSGDLHRNDGGDGRRRRPARHLLFGSARHERDLRAHRRPGSLVHRRAQPDSVGVFSALMRFVPYIGAFISALFPLALAAAVDAGWSMVIATAILFLVAEPLFGHVIEPLLYGHSTGMSPFAVIVSTLFWGFLWGPIGLILATPFTVCLVVLGRHVDSLEFLDIMLGDRPPLTPVENFYQRMLAGDPDEARELGEAMLNERSLSSYYDECRVEGLQLAANDYARGVVTPAQLEDIRASARSLVEDFEDRPRCRAQGRRQGRDRAVNPNAIPTLASGRISGPRRFPGRRRRARPFRKRGEVTPRAVRGRARPPRRGRGGGDGAVAAQARARGQVVPHGAVSRERIRDLDLTGVCDGVRRLSRYHRSPAHLRYLTSNVSEEGADGEAAGGIVAGGRDGADRSAPSVGRSVPTSTCPRSGRPWKRASQARRKHPTTSTSVARR